MPTIDLTDAEHAAVTASRRTGSLAPRLDPPRSALAKLDPAAAAPLRRPLTPESAKPGGARSPHPPKAVHAPPEAACVRRRRAEQAARP